MMGFSVGGWEDKVDPGRVRMDLVEDFEACISDNALWGMGGPAESRQLLVSPETALRELCQVRLVTREIRLMHSEIVGHVCAVHHLRCPCTLGKMRLPGGGLLIVVLCCDRGQAASCAEQAA